MKKLIVITLIFLALLLVSCNKEEKPADNGITISEISPVTFTEELSGLDVLSETILYTPSSDNALDEDYFDYYFGNKELLEKISDYAYYTSATTSVCEVGIFKVKDTEAKENLLSAFETRKNNLISTYENYSPEDADVASDMITGSFDDVVWFAATSDNASVKAVIEK
ncbi:MAG: DUF4358 domain-containing protein [Clostridia bacterium]|nr:DUF4358 domain-containing protein [Clostridia bacterium]